MRQLTRFLGAWTALAVIAAPALTSAASASASAPAAPARAALRAAGMTVINVGNDPSDVAVDPRTGTVWVANSSDNTVSKISEAKQAVVATITVGALPAGIAVDQRTGTVWVTCAGPFGHSGMNIVNEIKESSGKVIATIPVGQFPSGIAADPKTGTVWVANNGAGSVSEISEAGQNVIATISTPGDTPQFVAVDQARGDVWVASGAIDVLEISEATHSITGKVKVDLAPSLAPSLDGIAVDPATSLLWVASSYDTRDDAGDMYSDVTPIDPATRKILADIPVPYTGAFPNGAVGVAIDPSTSTVWTAENGFNSVTEISADRHQVARNLFDGPIPIAIALDPRTHAVFVANSNNATVAEYRYLRPRFTTAPHATFRAGHPGRFEVRTSGYPVAEMKVTGKLPGGLRVKIGQGTVIISGTAARSARNHTYRLTVTADNGVGTPKGQYPLTQHLVIRVS